MAFIISNKLQSLDNKAINDISEIDQCSVKYLLICHCWERSPLGLLIMPSSCISSQLSRSGFWSE